MLLLLLTPMSALLAGDGTGGVTFESNVSGVGTSAAAFLEIGVGARAAALGNAYTAVANDPTALYWNPAGVAWATTMQIEIMQNNWIGDRSHQFAGVVVPLPQWSAALGFSITTLDFGQPQAVRTVDQPDGTGELYDARDMSVGLTYSMALTDHFSFGITGKYVHERIWSVTSSGFAADLGILYKTQIEGLTLGAALSNFGTELQLTGNRLSITVDPDKNNYNFDRVEARYSTDSYAMPLLFRFGVAYETKFDTYGSLLLSVDVMHPSNATESISFGGEYSVFNLFYLRAGYENMLERDHINGMTLGAGVDYYLEQSNVGLRCDYSWSDWGMLGDAQRISVGVVF